MKFWHPSEKEIIVINYLDLIIVPCISSFLLNFHLYFHLCDLVVSSYICV
jgi:hypothetical protein